MTQTPLEASIEHWIHNRDNPETATLGPRSCDLCHQHRTIINDPYGNQILSCGQCPVYQKTQMVACVGSPYIAAVEAHDNWATTPNPDTLPAWTSAAQAEIDFLISLRKDPTT